MAVTTEHTFEDITDRLDEIIGQVRSKDTSLERSLDLFDEAIALGSRAVELVDSFDMSESEAAMLEKAAEGDGEAAGDASEDGTAAADETAPDDAGAAARDGEGAPRA